VIQTDVERYADPQSFAREVNLPLLGTSRLEPVPSGANLSALLRVLPQPDLAAVVDGLVETRQSLTLRTLLLAGFPEDVECFAVGVALAREWSRRGLKIAVVDLDFWNPTVVRPKPHPNEGFLDVLEYGCSFRRVAWEIVAEGLWLIGPGSHPPDGDRIADHPDWERAARGLAAHVDVALFVAPLLDRRGLVGRLSKRMDGVLLAASVDRVGRAELRDAFLELWGSDAPIIGCVGIEAARPPAKPDLDAAPAEVGVTLKRSAPAAAAPPTPLAVAPPGTPQPTGPAPAPRAPQGQLPPVDAHEPDDSDLTALLDREVRFGGKSYSPPRHRARAGLFLAVAAGLIVAASVGVVLTRQPKLPMGGETLPAGTERVFPAEPETPIPGDTGDGTTSDAAPDPGVATPPAGSTDPTGTTPPTADDRIIPPTSPTPDTPFRVHVASFKSEEKVQGLVRELRLRGADAWYEEAANASGYYRVFVGHFATEAEARAHARWLLDNGWVDRAQAYPSAPE